MLYVLAWLFCFVGVSSTSMEKLCENLKLSEPEKLLNASYDGKQVKEGNELTVTNAHKSPQITCDDGLKNKLLTVVMVDPDAPSAQNPKAAEWLHWLVVNIKDCKLAKGEIITPYGGPTPPKGTGFHRYGLFVFEQTDIVNADPITKRSNFKVKNFIESNGMKGPIEGNFFTCRTT